MKSGFRKAHYDQLLAKDVQNLKKKHNVNMLPDADNSLLQELQAYHSEYLATTNDITTRHLTDQVLQVLIQPSRVSDQKRKIVWSEESQNIYRTIREQCLQIPVPEKWTWAAKAGSNQYHFNHARMKLWVTKQCRFQLLERCLKCGTSALLLGYQAADNQMYCQTCRGDLKVTKATQKFDAEWQKVRPKDCEFPRRLNSDEYLPNMDSGDKAGISLYQTITTINY